MHFSTGQMLLSLLLGMCMCVFGAIFENVSYATIAGQHLTFDLWTPPDYPGGQTPPPTPAPIDPRCVTALRLFCPARGNTPQCTNCIVSNWNALSLASCTSQAATIAFWCVAPFEKDESENPDEGANSIGIAKTDLFPLVVFIHGGDWARGSKEDVLSDCNELAGTIAQAGRYAVLSMNYRLWSQHGEFGSEPVTFPVQFNDVSAAVEYVTTRAGSYGIDVSRMVCVGQDAGAHLCSLLGTHGQRTIFTAPKLAVPIFGAVDLLLLEPDAIRDDACCDYDHDEPSSPGSRLLNSAVTNVGLGEIRDSGPDGRFANLFNLAVTANPINWVTRISSEFFIVHGDRDNIIPFQQSARLSTALTTASRPNTLTIVRGGTHDCETAAYEDARASIVRWVTSNL